jgi:hypothetical protein
MVTVCNIVQITCMRFAQLRVSTTYCCDNICVFCATTPLLSAALSGSPLCNARKGNERETCKSVCAVRYSVRDDGTHLNRVVGVICWAHRKPGRHQSASSNRPATCTSEHTWKRVSAADARTKRQQLRLVEPVERNRTQHRVERCGRRSVFVRNRRTRWWGVAREK